MTLDELRGERQALEYFKEWLEQKLEIVKLDIEDNENDAAAILEAMRHAN